MEPKQTLTLPPAQSGKHSILDHNKVYIYPEIISVMAGGTEIQSAWVEKGTHVVLIAQWKHTEVDVQNMEQKKCGLDTHKNFFYLRSL